MSRRSQALSYGLIGWFIVSIALLTINFQIGLTLFFIGTLMYAATIVRNRLLVIGAESFALGSVLVWLGFAIASLPIIALAWDFFATGTQVVLFVVGLVLGIFGYTAEYYELNQRFLELLQTARAQLTDIWATIRKRFFRSVWTLIATIFVLYGVAAFFVPALVSFLPNPVTEQEFLPYLYPFIIALLALLVEFRAVVKIGVITFLGSIALLLSTIGKRLRNFPGLVWRFLVLLRKYTVSSFRTIRSAVVQAIRGIPSFLQRLRKLTMQLLRSIYQASISIIRVSINNSSLVSFALAVFIGIFAIIDADQILGSSAIVLLIVGLASLIGQRRELVTRSIGSVQHTAYRRSFQLRNLTGRRASGLCPNCGAETDAGKSICMSCNKFLPRCLVCRNPIYAGDETLTCSSCNYQGHSDHIQNWIMIKPTCPNCKVNWGTVSP